MDTTLLGQTRNRCVEEGRSLGDIVKGTRFAKFFVRTKSSAEAKFFIVYKNFLIMFLIICYQVRRIGAMTTSGFATVNTMYNWVMTSQVSMKTATDSCVASR